MITLKIAEFDPSGILAIGLADILSVLHGRGEAMQWSLLWLQAAGAFVDVVSDSTFSSQTGTVLSWKELLALASQIHEIEDLVLVGTQPGSALLTLEEVNSGQLNAEVIIECVDSSYWLVSSADGGIIKNVRDGFMHVEEA